MSYAIHPFAVPLPELDAAIGSKDQALLETITEWAGDELDTLDEQFDEDREDYDEPEAEGFDDPPTMRDALRDLIFAAPHDNQIAARRYVYLLELLCRYYGEFLSNDQWSPFKAAWMSDVDDALSAAGVPAAFSVTHLTAGGAPVKVPRYLEESPSVGHLRGASVAAARKAFDAAGLPAKLSPDVFESVDQIRQWLGECERSGRDLVCFFH
jgi:alkylation response protein AidB-like acyl-CoA dehydrogenase